MKRRNVADELVEAMREAVAIAEGRLQPAVVHVVRVSGKVDDPEQIKKR